MEALQPETPPPSNGTLGRDGDPFPLLTPQNAPPGRRGPLPIWPLSRFQLLPPSICCSTTRRSKNNVYFSKLENGTKPPQRREWQRNEFSAGSRTDPPCQGQEAGTSRKETQWNRIKGRRQEPRPPVAKSCRKDNSPACQPSARGSARAVSRLCSCKRLCSASLHAQLSGARTRNEEEFRDQKYFPLMALMLGISRAGTSDFNSKLFLISGCLWSTPNTLPAPVQKGILQ